MRIYAKRLFLLILIIISCCFIGCGGNDTIFDDGKPIIAVTIPPQATFVKAVCGDLANVITTVPPGYSPESYEPTLAQRKALSSSSLYFAIGVNAEGSILPLLTNTKIIPLHAEIAAMYPDITFADGGRDPHVWLSIKRVSIMIDAIAREMCLLDSSNKQLYLNNAQSYKALLNDTDAQLTTMLSVVKNKSFISFHPSFGYFADDYGLKMYSLEEEGKEATAKHLQQMIDFAKQQNIKAVFYQKEIDSSQSIAFAEEIGGKTIQLEPLSEDYTQNLIKMAEVISEVIK
ncbi:MAG: zinc ABC transporter solute-binding protein [Clostridiaceae bacterium]|nr:zinc ABC transporter solute-binding protein [Clostridiaceae bacterium]